MCCRHKNINSSVFGYEVVSPLRLATFFKFRSSTLGKVLEVFKNIP